MKISVIIPTFNEAANIVGLIKWLQGNATKHLHEIIVTDGGSEDNTQALAVAAGAEVVRSTQKGRAAQMNAAAKIAGGDIFYFVHADVLPPSNCFSEIMAAVANGNPIGCFTYRFDSDDKWLKITALWNKMNWLGAGGGDQTLFVERAVFETLKGFKSQLIIMEDFDFVWRAKRQFPFKLIKNDALVSARKYKDNNFFKVQSVNIIMVLLFRFGFPQGWLCRMYKSLIDVR